MRDNYFVTAIDTDTGKSVVTGVLAAWLADRGVRVITQKMAQTGCIGHSEDIETHRRIMGVPVYEEDRAGMTCPYVYPFPAAPQLSAAMAGGEIDFEVIHAATVELERRYDCVLTEGVGGLMVPLAGHRTVLDYMKQYPQPVILVTNGKLGSINHTLLSLEVMKHHGIELVGMVYNQFIATDPLITADSLDTLQFYLRRYYPQAVFVEMYRWEEGGPLPDFSKLFGMN